MMATTQSKPTEQQQQDKPAKKKFDPNTLPAELKPIYADMQAQFTKKMQELDAKSKEFDRQAQGMRAQLEGAQRTIQQLEAQLNTVQSAGTNAAAVGANAATGQTGARSVGFNPVDLARYDPFDPQSVAGLIEDYFRQYHGYIENAWAQLWRSLLELQAYNYQVMRLVAKNPDIDIEKVVAAAPQYGNNLELAARALYESPKVYERAKSAEKLEADLAAARAKIAELERKSTPVGVLGGTVGPVPRTVAKGAPPRTYAEVAATEDPVSFVSPEGVAGTAAGTSGAETGAAQSRQ